MVKEHKRLFILFDMVLLVIRVRFHLHQIDLICKVAKEKFVETLAPEL